jgi:hypothetical protein
MTLRERALFLLREPLLHFLLIGALVYVLLAGRQPDPGERRIVVSEAVVGRLAERFGDSFRRAPSRDELDGLIRGYVQDEVYYREALRLGLDRDDEVVRMRMRNKMVALATGEAETTTPSDAQLQVLLDKDPARYAREVNYDFAQVYLGDDSSSVRAGAAAVLGRLRNGADPLTQSRPVPIPLNFANAPISDIAGQFGDAFAEQLRKLPEGQWSGPVASGLGLHLVRVARRSVPAPSRLAEVRQRVENDWRSAAIKVAEAKAYRDLLQGYDVVIERPR